MLEENQIIVWCLYHSEHITGGKVDGSNIVVYAADGIHEFVRKTHEDACRIWNKVRKALDNVE